MNRLGLLGLLCAALLGCWESGDALTCFDKQYQYKGRCCNRCRPGEKLVSECNKTEDSVCAPCENGHYQRSWTKEKHCAPHDICEDSKYSLVIPCYVPAVPITLCQWESAATHPTGAEQAQCRTCPGTAWCLPSPICSSLGDFLVVELLLWLHGLVLSCSCEEKGLMVKVKGTNTSDVICAESGRRSSLSVLIPITAAVVTCLVGVCIYCLVHT
ncbi:TNR5 factor, partial [Smithornis capensis]|nr:TNR5 factor [Smithornis capensis]